MKMRSSSNTMGRRTTKQHQKLWQKKRTASKSWKQHELMLNQIYLLFSFLPWILVHFFFVFYLFIYSFVRRGAEQQPQRQ